MTGAPGFRSGAALAGLLLGLLVGARSAVAAPDVVTLLEPETASPAQRRCLTRIREELVAGGFEVRVVDPGETDATPSAQPLQPSDAAATVAVIGDPAIGPSELLIVDRTGAHPDVWRIAVPDGDPNHAAEVLAIRTIEVLRASAMQRLVESSRARPPPPVVENPTPAPRALPVIVEKRPWFAFEFGIAVVDDVNGPGPAELPLARVRVRLRGPAFARLTVAGLGSRARVDDRPGASVAVGQNLAVVELGAELMRKRPVVPTITLGLGALYVTSDGSGVYPYPYVGKSDSRWTALVDGGIGILASFSKRWGLALEAHAFWAAPHPYVRIFGTNAGTIGLPGLALACTLVTWL
ncbi:MAG: hypothetical protein ABUS79_13165 [Pseudomonadota bacterium]